MKCSFTPTKGYEEEIVPLLLHAVFLYMTPGSEMITCDNEVHRTKTRTTYTERNI